MKRKKWSELEEQTLLSKYSELLTSGALSKLKTREKKFRPVAEHVNFVHHLQDPIKFPFRWSWRDVSIKVQNMRHQYLGVKQKIKVAEDEFNWKDGEDHWENFLKYKEVFGDVELEAKGKRASDNSTGNGHSDLFEDCCDLGFGIDSEEFDSEEEDGGDGSGDADGDDGCEDKIGSEGEGRELGETGAARFKKFRKGMGRSKCFGLLGAQIMEVSNAVVRREEKKREREFSIEKSEVDREEKRRELEFEREKQQKEREERLEDRVAELEEMEFFWARREHERRMRFEKEWEEERKRRMQMEEKREEEEMEWRERMLTLQMDHEKTMMQMHADACQNQMQILGVMARLFCQYFGAASDGLGAGLGSLPPQVLHSLHHPEGLGNVKPDSNSPSEFL